MLHSYKRKSPHKKDPNLHTLGKNHKMKLDYFYCQNYNNYAYQSFYFCKHTQKHEKVHV